MLLDDGITEGEASALLSRAWARERDFYRLDFQIVRAKTWPRPAFTAPGLIDALLAEPLEPPCDRVLAFVGRHAGDVLYGLAALVLPIPEFFGAVNGSTLTRSPPPPEEESATAASSALPSG